MGMIRVGVGYSAALVNQPEPPVLPQVFDFTSASLPADFAYTRSGAATYRDASGNLLSAAANVRRLAYNAGGVALGTLVEPAITNKFTGRNANPTDGAGWAKTGDAAANFGPVNDPGPDGGYIATQKLGAIMSSGKVQRFDNRLGTTPAVLTMSATFATTVIQTFSLFMAAVVGSATLSRTGSAASSRTITSASAFQRQAYQSSGHATTDQITLTVPAGGMVDFIGEQLEETAFVDRAGNPMPTSLVVTNAAATARGGDALVLASINTKPYYNEAEGSILVDCIPYAFSLSAPQLLFGLLEGVGTTNGYAARISQSIATDPGNIRRVGFAASAGFTTTAITKPDLGKRFRLAQSWKAGLTTTFAQFDYLDEPLTAQPTGMDRLVVGGWRGPQNQMFGVVRALKLFKKYRSVPQLGEHMFDAGDKAIIYAGQSNGYGHFRAQIDQDNDGVLAAQALMDQTITSPGRNWILNGCTNGSTVYGSGNDPLAPYWYNDVTNSLAGPAWTKFANLVQAFKNAGGTILRTMWKQGDGGIEWANQAKFKATTAIVFDGMAGLITGNRILVDQLARYRLTTEEERITQSCREAHWALCVERADCFRGPECFDVPIDDGPHYDAKLGYAVHGLRLMRRMLADLGYAIAGGIIGPKVTSWTRSGQTITINLEHEAGSGASDFNLSSGIRGFTLIDSTKLTTNNAIKEQLTCTKVSGTQLTATMTGAPAATDQLAFAWDQGFGDLNESYLNGSGQTVQVYTLDPTKFPKTSTGNALLPQACRLPLAA